MFCFIPSFLQFFLFSFILHHFLSLLSVLLRIPISPFLFYLHLLLSFIFWRKKVKEEGGETFSSVLFHFYHYFPFYPAFVHVFFSLFTFFIKAFYFLLFCYILLQFCPIFYILFFSFKWYDFFIICFLFLPYSSYLFPFTIYLFI